MASVAATRPPSISLRMPSTASSEPGIFEVGQHSPDGIALSARGDVSSGSSGKSVVRQASERRSTLNAGYVGLACCRGGRRQDQGAIRA